jgi:type II secretory pathway predicted ATPase ExeA
VDRGKAGLLEALIDHCETLCIGCSSPCLIVDDADALGADLDELASLVVASHMSRAFRLVVVGGEETARSLVARCASLVQQNVRVVVVAGFGAGEVARYFSDWVGSSQAPGSAPVLLTPDASLIIAEKSEGRLLLINQWLKTMLTEASLRGKRVLDSWDAWAATTFDEIDQRRQSRPPQWPTPEVLQILNEGRRKSGLLPRVTS